MKRIEGGLCPWGLALILFYFAPAGADGKPDRDIVVFDGAMPVVASNGATLSADFQVNRSSPDLGRAWIEITAYAPPPGSPDSAGETKVIRRNIPGLKYQPSTRHIVLDREGQAPIVCATLVEKRFLFFGSDVIEPTGHCKLTANIAPRSTDDGFEISKTLFGTVVFRTDGEAQ